jgi:hypothetical protein
MASPREIHVRANATGAWFVQADQAEVPLSWHTSETEAERAALIEAATYPDEPAIVVHDRYDRRHEAPLDGHRRS